MSYKNNKSSVISTSFTKENDDNNNYREHEQEQVEQNKEGVLSSWFRPDTGNSNGYGHQALVPLRQHMYSLPIYTRRLQVLTYALAEMSSAATLIADYTRSLLNLSRRLVICWESVLHAALMWQYVEKQTHRIVLQCVKRTWNKFHKSHFTHTLKKRNKKNNNNNRETHKHYFSHHLNPINKYNPINKSTSAAHSICTSSEPSLTHSSLSLPKLTNSFSHHVKQSNATSKGGSKLFNKEVSHSSEYSCLEETEEEEEDEKKTGKLCALLHNPEKEKRRRNAKSNKELWCKVQVAVIMNKHVHKVVRHALRHYYKHENMVASQLERLRSTIVAAILQQFLTVNVKESYHDTLLHSWLPRPQQNELINVSHSLIHSHVCNIISKLENEENKERESEKYNKWYEWEEEEEVEKLKRESSAFNRDGSQSSNANIKHHSDKNQKLKKAKESKETNNETSSLQTEFEKQPEEQSLWHVENNSSDALVLPTVVRKRHRSAAQSANTSKNSSCNANTTYSDKTSPSPSESIIFSTKSTSGYHKSYNFNRNNNIWKKECSNVNSNTVNSEKQSKSKPMKGKQTTSVPTQEEECEDEQTHILEEEHKPSYQYANWSNSLSLAFFMHAAASANSTLCALSIISRCVYNASHVISSDDESPQAWRRCRDCKEEQSHRSNNKKDKNNKLKSHNTMNAENDVMNIEEEEEEHTFTTLDQTQEEQEEESEKRDCKDESECDHDGFYYIIVAARAVNACNHAATCFGNRKFIFIECSDVEALLRRTEEEQEVASVKVMQRKANVLNVQDEEHSDLHYEKQTHSNVENNSQMCKSKTNTSSEERLITQEHAIDEKTGKYHEMQRPLSQTNTLPLIVKPKSMEECTSTPINANELQENLALYNNWNQEYCNNIMDANEMWLRSLLISQHRLLPAPPPSSLSTEVREPTKRKTKLYDAEEDEEMESINTMKRATNQKSISMSDDDNKQHNRQRNLYSCAECEENEDTSDEDNDASSSDEPRFIVMNALYCSLATNNTHQRSSNAESEDAEQLTINDSSFHAPNEINMHNSKYNNEWSNEEIRVNSGFEERHNINVRDLDFNHDSNESALVVAHRIPFTTSSSLLSPVALYESSRSQRMSTRYYDPNSNNTNNAFSNFAHTILMPPSSGQENANYSSNDNHYREDYDSATTVKGRKNDKRTELYGPKSHIGTSSIIPSEGDFAFAAELFARLQFWCVRGQDRSKFKACNILPHTNSANKHSAWKDVQNEKTYKMEEEEEEEEQENKEINDDDDDDDDEAMENEWRKEFVQRPVKLLSTSVGNMTFHFTRYGATVNNLHHTSETTDNDENSTMDESNVFGANIRGQELLYEALNCTTHVVICEVRESRAHKDYHDALHVLSLPHESSTNYINRDNNKYMHSVNMERNEKINNKKDTSTEKSCNQDEGSFVELATLSDDEADPYRYDRQSKLNVRAVVEWAQGEMVVSTNEPRKKGIQQEQLEEEEFYYNQHYCKKPLPSRERRQRRNEMLKNEFRLARSTRLDALLVDEINDKAIATIVLEATHAPYTTQNTENKRNNTNSDNETVNSPLNISKEQAVQNTTYSIVSFSQYIAPLWDHMHREKAIMVDLDRTLVDNAIILSSSNSSLSLSPSQSLLLSSSSSSSSVLQTHEKMANKNNEAPRLLPQLLHSIPRTLHLNDSCNSCWNERTGAQLSEIAELFPSLLQQRISAKCLHNLNGATDTQFKLHFHSHYNALQQYAYRCSVSYHVCQSAHTDDTIADFAQPPIHEIVYIRPDVRTWLHHMSVRWNIPLILVTKSTRLRAEAILSQLLDPCELLFTNAERQLITSCQVEFAKKKSIQSGNEVNSFTTTENSNKNNSKNSKNMCERQEIATKSAYHVLRIFDCLDKTRNHTNSFEHNTKLKEWKQEQHLCKSCQARSIAIVDDAVQVWESTDWPRAIAIAPYTLSRVDPTHYLSVNGGYISSLVLSALYSKKQLTCPFAELPTNVLHKAQNVNTMNNQFKTNTYDDINNNYCYEKVHCICSCVAPCCTSAVEQRRRRKREETRHVDRSIKQFHVYYTSPRIESSSALPRLPPIPITTQITQEPETIKGNNRSKAFVSPYNNTNTGIIDENKLIHRHKALDTRNTNSSETSRNAFNMNNANNNFSIFTNTPFPSSSVASSLQISPWATATSTTIKTSSALSSSDSSRSLSTKEWEEQESFSSSTSSSFSSSSEEELEEITPVSVMSSTSSSIHPSEEVESQFTNATQRHLSQHAKQHPKHLLHKQRHKHVRKARMTPPTPTEFASQSQTTSFGKIQKSKIKNNLTTLGGNNTIIASNNTSGVHDTYSPGRRENRHSSLGNKQEKEESQQNKQQHEEKEEQNEEQQHEVEDVVNAEEAVVDEGADEDVNVFAQANQNDTFDWQVNKKNKSSSIWADDTVEDVVPLETNVNVTVEK